MKKYQIDPLTEGEMIELVELLSIPDWENRHFVSLTALIKEARATPMDPDELYIGKDNTWRYPCGCAEAVVLDGGHQCAEVEA